MITKALISIITYFTSKKKLLDILLDDVEKELIYTLKNKYLLETGWIESYRENRPVTKNKDPIPWMTLPFINFIEQRLNRDLSVFEYGSGSSTHYLASKVGEVFSVEHDIEWFNLIQEEVRNLTNAHILYEKLEYGGDYSNKINSLDRKFDLVIVDGRDRVNCCLNSIHSLSDRGVIILDDSERDDYTEALDFLKNRNMRRIDFWGIAPGLCYKKATSVFYKEGNCMNL